MHGNDLAGTTDVASRPEFASRRASNEKGEVSWWVEDFDWAEVSLRLSDYSLKLLITIILITE